MGQIFPCSKLQTPNYRYGDLKTGLREEAGLAETGGLAQPRDGSLGPIAKTETAERAQDLGQATRQNSNDFFAASSTVFAEAAASAAAAAAP